jgi:drug/metabolite transporter (DMT)-like permease
VSPGVLALIAAFLFALAATLQQKGALGLPRVSLSDPSSLARLAKQRAWLLGTTALLVAYGVQAVALDRGQLAIVQPLLVTTVVFALPLGYLLTGQRVGRREVLGAVVVIVGLAVFGVFGEPASGRSDAPTVEWAIAIVVIGAVSGFLLVMATRGDGVHRAAYYGIVSGALFGLSACLVKPTLQALHVGVSDVLTSWEFYGMAAAGIIAFILQQVSLGVGFLATSVATVSVTNPIVSVTLGALILDERLSRPAWHVVLAIVGVALAMAGAVVISTATESHSDGGDAGETPESEPTTASS